jgi:hypothetical protein
MEGEHEHSGGDTTIVQPVESAVAPVVDHTIDHAERLTRNEERMTQHVTDTGRQLEELRSDFLRQLDETRQGVQSDLAGIAGRLDSMATPVIAPVEEGVEFVAPEIDESKAPKDAGKGRRARRKSRRGK